MKVLKSLMQLFYPESCVCCETNLLSSEILICSHCRHDLPYFENFDYQENSLSSIFKGKIPLAKVGAFFIFRKQGKVKNLIHQLKYRGKQEIGNLLGYWISDQLKSTKIYDDIDVIIPVPLHKKKLKKRGYNQLTTFGITIAEELNISYQPDVLVRSSFTKTQTFKKRFERFVNTQTKFELNDLTHFENKHILLIDDVITTGATIEACCKELLNTKNIKISVFALAFTV